mmetsp:Transcript_9157/g.41669  ORF Transcript_9157/g.41669 Transcript_9157/m.41669 type:complete len:247 (-) Transcript_9157:1460-2200(-)
MDRTCPLRRICALAYLSRSLFRGFLWSLFLCGVRPRLSMIFLPTLRLSAAPISSSGRAMMPALRRYFSSLAARLRSRSVAAPSYSSSSSTGRRRSRAASRSASSSSSLALAAIFLVTPRSYLSRRSPRVSRMGRSSSPVAALAFLGLAPSCVTVSTSLVRFLVSSSSATSTRSATSSPKSPTCESELTDRVVAFWRRRSVLERGTRVNMSSSILARASMRANSRLAKALCMSPSSPPSSSGASPSS